jgi:hypothetical protein
MMADSAGANVFVDAWKKQVEEGTQAWTKLAGQMGAAGVGSGPTASDPMNFWRPFLDPTMAAWSKLFSQGPPSPDMIAQWKQLVDQWIAAWSKAQSQAMGTEAFGQALGQYLDKWLSVQGPAKKMADESTESTLQAMGLPSRHQVVGIAQLLMDLDDRIDALDDRLAALTTMVTALSKLSKPSDNPQPAAAPSGTPKKKRNLDQPSNR